MNHKEDKEKLVIKSRVFNLVFEPPFFSMARGCYTCFTQEDLINIYRQVKNTRIKQQIKEFIYIIDRQQEIESNIDGYVLPRTQKENPEKRIIITYKHPKRTDD